MTDPTITIGLGSFALLLTIALQALRATHYDGKLEKLRVSISEWLQVIENELKAELKTLIAQAVPDPPIDRVVDVAANFSSVKEKQTRVDELRTTNSRSIQTSIVVALSVITAAFVSLYATDTLFVELAIIVGAVVWLTSIYNVHQFIGEYNVLEENARKRGL